MNKNALDLRDQRFGKLTAIDIYGYRVYSTKTKKILWHCKCDCGNFCNIPATCLRSGKSKSCGCVGPGSKGKFREAASNWKGGKIVNSGGYIKLYQPSHPSSSTTGYIGEHRVVMEQHLGRFLLAAETVHHKNGNRADNRLENLELWSSNHPSGQRVEDLVAWAKELLEIYGK